MYKCLYKLLAPLVQIIQDVSCLIALDILSAVGYGRGIVMYKQIGLLGTGIRSPFIGCAFITSETVQTLLTSLILGILVLLLYICRSRWASSRFLARADSSTLIKRVAMAMMIDDLFSICSSIIESRIRRSICITILMSFWLNFWLKVNNLKQLS